LGGARRANRIEASGANEGEHFTSAPASYPQDSPFIFRQLSFYPQASEPMTR